MVQAGGLEPLYPDELRLYPEKNLYRILSQIASRIYFPVAKNSLIGR